MTMPVACCLTTTEHFALTPPSTDITVITVSPLDFAVTLPLSSTDATSGSEDSHVKVLSDALTGKTVACSCDVIPLSRVSVSELSSRDSTC